jgi:glutathione S-transferase
MTMKLFYTPYTCALASHIALEDAGADYEAVFLDFRKEAQRKPEYLAINPKGRVPALVVDNDRVLTETPAILAYIAQSFPDARLAPIGDPFAFAQAQSFNSYLCSTVHVAHAHAYRGYRWADDEASFADMKRKMPQAVGECFDLIEREFFVGPWVMGDQYTVCDPYLFTMARWWEMDGIDPARFPRIQDHRHRMTERAAVQKVLAVELDPRLAAG